MNPPTHSSSLGDFQQMQKLGEGSYSVVYKVRRIIDGKEYALKKVKLNLLKEKEKENSLNEVRLLASIEDDYIVAYKEAFIDEESLCIVMELLSKGDVQKRINAAIKKREPSFSEADIWKAIVHMTKGLKTLHEQQIVHRDLKCANIFLSEDGKFKLGDLNVSKIAKMGLVYTQTGTPYYASPEVWRDEPYDNKSDIWSLGCVLYEMATLNPPFRAPDMESLFKKVQKGLYDKIPLTYSKDLAEVIGLMLKVNPQQRPTCDDLLNHQLVKKNFDMKQFEANQKQGQMLKTIQLPRNLVFLKERLPKSKYDNDQKTNKSFDKSTERQNRYSKDPQLASDTRNSPINRVQCKPSMRIPSQQTPSQQLCKANNQQIQNPPKTQENSKSPVRNNEPKLPLSQLFAKNKQNPQPDHPQSAQPSSNLHPIYSPIYKNLKVNKIESACQQPSAFNGIYHEPDLVHHQKVGEIRHVERHELNQPSKLSERPGDRLYQKVSEPSYQKPIEKTTEEKPLERMVNQSGGKQIQKASELQTPKYHLLEKPNHFIQKVFPVQAIVQKQPKTQPNENLRQQLKKNSESQESIDINYKGALKAAVKVSRPLSTNIVPDHQTNTKQKQMTNNHSSAYIGNNYSHYFPIEYNNNNEKTPINRYMSEQILHPPYKPLRNNYEIQKQKPISVGLNIQSKQNDYYQQRVPRQYSSNIYSVPNRDYLHQRQEGY